MTLLLRLDPAGLSVLDRVGDRLATTSRFVADETGHASFVVWVTAYRGGDAELLLDLPEERFAVTELPSLSWLQRRHLLARRIKQLGGDAAFGRAWPSRRRNASPRWQLAALSESRRLWPWLDALSAAGVALISIRSTALTLAAGCGGAGEAERCLLVYRYGRWVRHCLIESGLIRYSRWLESAAFSPWLEIEHTRDYLAGQPDAAAEGSLRVLLLGWEYAGAWPEIAGVALCALDGTLEAWLVGESVGRRRENHYLCPDWRRSRYLTAWRASVALATLALFATAAAWGAQAWVWQRDLTALAAENRLHAADAQILPVPRLEFDAAWALWARYHGSHPQLDLDGLGWRSEAGGPVLALTVRWLGAPDPAGFAAAVEALRRDLASRPGASASLRASPVPLAPDATLRLGEGAGGQAARAVLEWRPG